MSTFHRNLLLRISTSFWIFHAINSFNLECDFKEDSVSHCECAVKSLNVTKTQETITSVNNETDPTIFTYLNVISLSIENQNMKFFPKGIDKFFPSLEIIKVLNSSLESLEPSDIEAFKKLRKLSVMQNEYFDSETFRKYAKSRLIMFIESFEIFKSSSKKPKVVVDEDDSTEGSANKAENVTSNEDLQALKAKVELLRNAFFLTESKFQEKFSNLSHLLTKRDQKIMKSNSELNVLYETNF